MSKKTENITDISLEKLLPFQEHPFLVRDDEQMAMIVESIRSVGVLVPAIVRPLEGGFYEIISGHRRKHACELLGLLTLPCIVRDADRDAAIGMMVDSNFQREEILPSERAKAYKMKLEAMKRQGARTDLTSDHVGQKLERKSSRDLIAENSPDSSSQIQRYLAGATYQVIAAEDIYTGDGTLRVAAGTLVAEITTGDDGAASTQELYLGR